MAQAQFADQSEYEEYQRWKRKQEAAARTPAPQNTNAPVPQWAIPPELRPESVAQLPPRYASTPYPAPVGMETPPTPSPQAPPLSGSRDWGQPPMQAVSLNPPQLPPPARPPIDWGAMAQIPQMVNPSSSPMPVQYPPTPIEGVGLSGPRASAYDAVPNIGASQWSDTRPINAVPAMPFPEVPYEPPRDSLPEVEDIPYGPYDPAPLRGVGMQSWANNPWQPTEITATQQINPYSTDRELPDPLAMGMTALNAPQQAIIGGLIGAREGDVLKGAVDAIAEPKSFKDAMQAYGITRDTPLGVAAQDVLGTAADFTVDPFLLGGPAIKGARAVAPKIGEAVNVANKAITSPKGQAIAKQLAPGLGIEDVSGATPPGKPPKPPGTDPLPPVDPVPPVPPPTGGLPSGKVPGGPHNVKPFVPGPSGLERLSSALDTETPTINQRVNRAWQTVRDEMYNSDDQLRTIAKGTDVPVVQMAKIVPGATAYGEVILKKRWFPELRGLGKGDVDTLERYMVLRREQDILAFNPSANLPVSYGWGDNFRTLDALKAAVGPDRFAKVERVANKLYELNQTDILSELYKNGMMTKAEWAATTSKHPHYIDFAREDFSAVDKAGKAMGKADVSGSGLKEMKPEGSSRKLSNPLARNMAQVIRTQQLISENRAANAIIESLFVQQKSVADELGIAVANMPRSVDKVRELLAKKRGVPINDIPEQQPIIWLLKKGEEGENSAATGVIHAMREGEVLRAQIPSPIAEIAQGLGQENADRLTRIFAKISQPTRLGATAYNLDFIIRNPTRDLQSAYVMEGLSPLSRVYWKGWLSVFNTDAALVQAAQEGALGSGLVESIRTTDALARSLMIGKGTVRRWRDIPRWFIENIERVNIAGERATRMGVWHKLQKDPSVVWWDRSSRVRDVNVDFAKSGNLMRLINMVLPFSNASLQGAVNTLKLIKNHPRDAMIRSAPFAAISAGVFVWNRQYGEEITGQIPDYYNTFSWPLIIGTWESESDPKFPNKPSERHPIFIPIPKAPPVALLTAPAELALKLGWHSNSDDVLDIVIGATTGALRGLSPIEPNAGALASPVIGTTLQAVANKDLFRGQAIVPRGEQDLPVEDQFGPETSRLAVAAGKVGISPRIAEFWMRDVFAGVGTQGLWAGDKALGAAGYDPNVVGQAFRQPSADIEALGQTPLVRQFIRTTHSGETNRGYEELDKATEEAQRLLWQNKSLRDLGIRLVAADNTLTIPNTKASIVLEPIERAILTEVIGVISKDYVDSLLADPRYMRLLDNEKREAIRKMMSSAREDVKNKFLEQMGQEELRRRAIESAPMPLDNNGMYR